MKVAEEMMFGADGEDARGGVQMRTSPLRLPSKNESLQKRQGQVREEMKGKLLKRSKGGGGGEREREFF